MRVTAGLALTLAVVGTAASCSDGSPPPEHLILITVDTWRGDHVLVERAGTALTPNLGRFAESSIVYTDASSVSNCTGPGTAGILTGLVPTKSHVGLNSSVLRRNVPTLATLLGGVGFRTAAFVANPVLRGEQGWENGFDEYTLFRKTAPRAKARAEELTGAALRWLDAGERGRRVFLWLQFMEPHGPYEPEPEVLSLFPRQAFDAPVEVPLLKKGDNSGMGGIPSYQQVGAHWPKGDARDYLARYAGEVRSIDHAIGSFLDELKARGILERSVVVVTSDHGEALVDDHGYFFSHQNGLTQDQVHVPLLLSYPGCAAGLVVDRAVSTLDVLPTALDLLGFAPAAYVDGRHLLDTAPRLVPAVFLDRFTVRDEQWQLAFRRGEGYRLIDLARGPEGGSSREREDVLRRLKPALQRLRSPPADDPVRAATR